MQQERVEACTLHQSACSRNVSMPVSDFSQDHVKTQSKQLMLQEMANCGIYLCSSSRQRGFTCAALAVSVQLEANCANAYGGHVVAWQT